jgi:hypothetical protein
MGLLDLAKDINISSKATQAYIANEMFIFPEATNLTCQFAANVLANNWSAWTTIVDSAATTLASRFTRDAFLDQCSTDTYSADNNYYMLEIGYGATPTIAARSRFISATAATGPLPYFIDLRSAKIPAGSAMVYRLMCATGAATLRISFRYYFFMI